LQGQKESNKCISVDTILMTFTPMLPPSLPQLQANNYHN